MADQKYTYRNQAQEILDYIKDHPGTCTEGIVSGTGWNRHLVEVAVKLMVEQGLVKEMGQTDWLDFKYEAIDRDGPKPTKAEQIIAEVSGFVGKINQDLQLSTPSGLFDASPFQKAATALSGLTTAFFTPYSDLIANALDREQLVTEIAVLANLTTDEVKKFYQTRPYSLEFIKAAIQAGAKLDEEDIKRTMEERVKYSFGWSPLPTPVEIALTKLEERHTFIVALPNNDRREVKAAYMEVDGATLYFEDEDRETILAFGPGHWVWAERKEDDTP